MIAISGRLEFADAAQRDAAVADTAALQAATRSEEPGCLAYVFAADPVDPCVVQVFELWTDEASLAAHFAHPNYLATRSVLRRYERISTATAKHRIDVTEPVYDATHTPRADFFSIQEPT